MVVGVARASHVLSSKCLAGFAVAESEGRVYTGSYEELVAHNLSLGLVQAVVVVYVVTGGGGIAGEGYGFMVVVLVEPEGVVVTRGDSEGLPGNGGAMVMVTAASLFSFFFFLNFGGLARS